MSECVSEGGREEGGRTGKTEGRRTRRSGYRTKNKNPTRQCGEKICLTNMGISIEYNYITSKGTLAHKNWP